MFYYINGTVAVLEENLAVLDCGGVGYACNTTAYTLAQLQLGTQQKLYTYCNIREDAFDIFGFSTKEELNCFNRLLSVSGVGPKAALAILSSITPDQLTLAIMTGDERTLTMAQGVGKKMAQRIILELKDKMGGSNVTLDFSGGAAAVAVPQSNNAAMATAALQELGYSSSEIAGALKGVDPTASTEEMVRFALRAMVMKG